MNKLSELSQEMGNLVKSSGASVVRVAARKRFPATGIVWSEDGLIISANHVVRHDKKIMIGFADGTEAAGQLVGRDPSTDLVLLKTDMTGLSPLKSVDEESIEVGNLVFALGRPGRTVQATMGIVSAYGPAWRTRRGGQADKYIQTDVLMYPGFSGGPLVSSDGLLIGLNSSALMHGASVALPVSTLSRVASALQQHGRVRRGYLGVSTQIVKLQDKIREELGQKSGLLITSVEASSPADEGGLTIGDTIVGVDSSPIRRHDDLVAELMRADFDQKVPVTVVRGGEIQTFNVRIAERD